MPSSHDSQQLFSLADPPEILSSQALQVVEGPRQSEWEGERSHQSCVSMGILLQYTSLPLLLMSDSCTGCYQTLLFDLVKASLCQLNLLGASTLNQQWDQYHRPAHSIGCIASTFIHPVLGQQRRWLASYPRHSWGEKRAWYTLYAHARNHLSFWRCLLVYHPLCCFTMPSWALTFEPIFLGVSRSSL